MKANCKVLYFKLMESEFKTSIDLSVQRKAIAESFGWQNIPVVNIKSLDSIKHAIRNAAKEVTTAWKNARDDRDLHLDECAEFWTQGDEPKKANYVKQLKTREKQAALFGRFNIIRGKSNTGSVKTLSIPTNPEAPNKEWQMRRIFDQEEMDHNLILRNGTHFSQANGTPPDRSKTGENTGTPRRRWTTRPHGHGSGRTNRRNNHVVRKHEEQKTSINQHPHYNSQYSLRN